MDATSNWRYNTYCSWKGKSSKKGSKLKLPSPGIELDPFEVGVAH